MVVHSVSSASFIRGVTIDSYLLLHVTIKQEAMSLSGDNDSEVNRSKKFGFPTGCDSNNLMYNLPFDIPKLRRRDS